MAYRLSVDVGGTFTDIVLFDDENKKIHTTKVSSMFSQPLFSVPVLVSTSFIGNRLQVTTS